MSSCNDTDVRIFVGDRPKLIVKARDGETGSLFDPTTVKIIVISPTLTRTELTFYNDTNEGTSDPEITREGTGIYSIEYDIVSAGTHKWGGVFSGNAAKVGEGSFVAETSSLLT